MAAIGLSPINKTVAVNGENRKVSFVIEYSKVWEDVGENVRRTAVTYVIDGIRYEGVTLVSRESRNRYGDRRLNSQWEYKSVVMPNSEKKIIEAILSGK